MVATLARAAPTLTVALLLEALRQTLEFEQFVAKKFSAPVCSQLPHQYDDDD
jgi:hypothetical protein